MVNFGMEDNDVGNSSTWLLARFRISKLLRLASAGGTVVILLCDNVMRVRLYIVTEIRRKLYDKLLKSRN